ncbi:hypothetical protein [Mycobacterium shimoidei]|uniref:hypothetical protein n=1 Tax=Mycobacterium shimoidei TaxID=29313 RepID=UPI000848344C|nr:hypothetical protein [Mycobacterium shimoidei]MCV7259623.1 hypothetical protein [Mycobacterium shimoidei]ODR12197.1 hypothetical protein BHQ16_16745 [Mycobacterium shimoidei]ORW78019.1 hypothetical protein AWC26_18515 [Mycobacterium shimoidei]
MRTVFLGSEAVAQGRLTRHELRRWHRAIFRDVYVPSRHEVTLRDRIEGAWLWSRRRAIIAGVAASTLHGAAWVDDDIPIEVIWTCTRPPSGVIARDETLAHDELTRVACLPVTTVARTAYDLGRRLPRDQAVARMDALMHATPFSIEDVLLLAKRYPGARGLRRLRTALPLVDGGAASPKETWLRLLLIDAGFPTPTTQIPLHENWQLVALLDMGWEQYRVAAEYDGDHHRTDQRVYRKDQRRLRKLEMMGWIVIRVIAGDTPDDVISRVRAALVARGWRP